jgi:uncharacterized phage protein (TIGR01671 family)
MYLWLRPSPERRLMRQYRGLTKAGKWVRGDLVRTDKYCHIVQTTQDYQKIHAVINAAEDGFESNDIAKTFILVIPETVGQQVGLKDRNRVEIFEGDIVKVKSKDASNLTGRKPRHYKTLLKMRGKSEVIFKDGEYKIKKKGKRGMKVALNSLTITFLQLEIIGNIHQNPELQESK